MKYYANDSVSKIIFELIRITTHQNLQNAEDTRVIMKDEQTFGIAKLKLIYT